MAISYFFKNLWKRIEEKKSKLKKTNSMSQNQINETSFELKAQPVELSPSIDKNSVFKETKAKVNSKFLFQYISFFTV